MIYIVATHSFLVKVELDAHWHVINYEVLDTEHHYGTIVINDIQMLSVKRKGNKNDNPYLSTYHVSKSNNLTMVSSVPLVEEIGDVHQIASANNDGIFITNTLHNSLVYQSLSSNKRHEHFFGDISVDINHPNSIYPCGERVFVLLHNRGQKETEVAVLHHDISKGFELQKLVSLWHKGGHNIFVEENYLYYNASDAGEFVIVDLRKERIKKMLHFSGHTKGLSATQDHFVIGFSDHTSRDERYASRGYLAVIDRRSLSIIKIIDLNFSSLPHPIGNINEIRCLTDKELAQSGSPYCNIDWQALRLSDSDLFYQVKSRISEFAKRINHSNASIGRKE
jgi:hypothetical protein